MSNTLDKMEFHPIEFVTEPQGQFVQVLRNRWWMVNDKDEIAIYDKRYPQCNAGQIVTAQMVRASDWAVDAVQIPLAFVTIDPRDWQET